MGIEIQPPAAPTGTVGALAGAVPVAEPVSTPVSGTAAVATAVVLTLGPVAGQAVRLTALSASYAGATTTGVLTVVSNGVTLLQLDIQAAGVYPIPLPPGGLEGAAGFSMVITLAAGGAGSTGRLNAASYFGT